MLWSKNSAAGLWDLDRTSKSRSSEKEQDHAQENDGTTGTRFEARRTK